MNVWFLHSWVYGPIVHLSELRTFQTRSHEDTRRRTSGTGRKTDPLPDVGNAGRSLVSTRGLGRGVEGCRTCGWVGWENGLGTSSRPTTRTGPKKVFPTPVEIRLPTPRPDTGPFLRRNKPVPRIVTFLKTSCPPVKTKKVRNYDQILKTYNIKIKDKYH